MVFDDLPRMVLHDAAITHNIDVMRRFCESSGVLLAPHAKTHMSPELASRQLAAGAWALTAATTAQVRQLVGFGAPRVLHANVLVDRAAIGFVASTFLSAPHAAAPAAPDAAALSALSARDAAAPDAAALSTPHAAALCARDAAALAAPDAAGPSPDATAPPEYLCYVDSLDGLRLLETELASLQPVKPLRVLVEVGFTGGRTGTRSIGAALELGRAVAAARWVELGGVAGYEGLMPLGVEADPGDGGEGDAGAGDAGAGDADAGDAGAGDADAGDADAGDADAGDADAGDAGAGDAGAGRLYPAGARGFMAGIRSLVIQLHDEGLFAATPVVTAGGSSYFDLVADELGPQNFAFDVLTVLRSGCYITHDHGVYERTSPFGSRSPGSHLEFEPAFELLASVLSQPEPGLVIVGFGRREAPTDDRLPTVLGGLPGEAVLDVTGWEVFAVNDHHAYLRVPLDTNVRPGTVLRFGISHPCGAFDRWRRIPLVAPGYAVVGMVSPAL